MRGANKPDTDRAYAHMRWAERYNRKGQPQKAIAHFGRALDYTAEQRFGGGPLDAFTALAGHPGLTSVLPAAVVGTGTGTGIATIVSTAPLYAGPSPQGPRRSSAKYAEDAKKARDLTSYSELGNQNQMRLLMRMRYYHVAAVIVGSISDTEFDESARLMNIRFGMTSPVTLLRNVMAQTEELSSYVAAKKKDDAIRMLDNDPMRGNTGLSGWILGAGKYTDSVSETQRKSTPSTVTDIFPALRYEPGQISVTGNGVFDGCRTIADRCDKLATLYDLYAGTTTDAGKVLLASLAYAKSKSNENHDLIEWAIKDIEEAQKDGRVVDMLSVVIAATADRGEAYVIKGIQYLIVYYHVQLKNIADAQARSSNDELAAVVQYMQDLVNAVTTNTIRRACNIARMMADAFAQFEAYSRMNVKPSRIFARMWVDLTYGLYDSFPGKSEKIQALYDAARVIVNETPFHHEAPTFLRKTANEIVESVKDALNKDKNKKDDERRETERREAERREAERRDAEEQARKRREAEEKARKQKEAEDKKGMLEPHIEIEAHHMARKALGLPRHYEWGGLGDPIKKSVTKAELLAAGYTTLRDFKAVYRTASKELHPDKMQKERKHLDDKPMIALNALAEEAKSLY